MGSSSGVAGDTEALHEPHEDVEVVAHRVNDLSFRFAGLVLVPPNLLREKISYHESRAKAAGFPPSMLYEGEGFHRLVQSLGESFGVSREPVEIRLSKDNFI